MEILLIIFGIVIGSGIALLVARSRFAAQTQEVRAGVLVEQEKNKNLERHVSELKRDLESERQKVLESNNSLASVEADYRNLQEKLQDQKKELETFVFFLRH